MVGKRLRWGESIESHLLQKTQRMCQPTISSRRGVHCALCAQPRTKASGVTFGISLRGGLGRGGSAHALLIEDEGFRFGLGALGQDLVTIPEEADTGGVADPDDQLARGVEGSRGGSDQSFLGDELAVGGDGDPGVLSGADDEFESGRRFVGGFRDRGARGTDGRVSFLFDLNRIRICAGSRCGDRSGRVIGSGRSCCGRLRRFGRRARRRSGGGRRWCRGLGSRRALGYRRCSGGRRWHGGCGSARGRPCCSRAARVSGPQEERQG